MREYVMDKKDKDLIRSIQLVLLSWGNENPHDAELVSRGVGLLNRIADSGKEDTETAGKSVTLIQKDADFVLGILREFAVLNGSNIGVLEMLRDMSSSIIRGSVDRNEAVSADNKDFVKFLAETIFSAISEEKKSALFERREKIIRSIELLTVGSDKE